MQAKFNTFHTIMGKKGYGKSSLCDILLILNNRPALILDTTNGFPPLGKNRLFFDDMEELNLYLQLHYKEFISKKQQLILQTRDPEQFEELCITAYKCSKISLFIDEVDFYCGASLSKKSAFYDIIHTGRHQEIDLYTASRRPANISRDLTSQTDIFYLTMTTENRDFDYIKQAFGEDVSDKIKTIKPFHFLVIDKTKTNADGSNPINLLITKKEQLESIYRLNLKKESKND
ncbi:hypothetical protein BKH41_00690 [Helicobacter sp. 12S02232-10]|uniref:hypothetical protein n=1 Tax=Helicobacter sp. 12S02232-10 TaxID=1476197 RepID=UPI000BA665B7|nr:hypothetical protein [Helicobacter sp. 12S02232-10]PAF49852.1 hypothetical protein BKH41_00690 [Helicobacter sp. 12S02232-10]